MPSQRAVLEMLTRSDLLMLVTHHKLKAEDRRVRDQLIAALLKVSFSEALAPLSAASLKHLVAELALTPAGKKKDALIEALVQVATPRRAAKKTTPKVSPRQTDAETKKTAAKRSPTRKGDTSKKVAAPAKPVKLAKPVEKSKLGNKAKKTRSSAPPAQESGKVAGSGKRQPKAASVAVAPKVKAPAKADGRKKRQVSTRAVAPPEDTSPSPAGDADSEATPSPKRPGQISSWAEVALAAAARGQSAESMLKPVGPARHVHTNARKCAACGEKLSLRKCSVQACSHMLLADSRQKICAECRFERNTLSMTDFEEVLAEERACPHCAKSWRKGG